MADRPRDYKAEYAARKAANRAKGLTGAAASGQGTRAARRAARRAGAPYVSPYREAIAARQAAPRTPASVIRGRSREYVRPRNSANFREAVGAGGEYASLYDYFYERKGELSKAEFDQKFAEAIRTSDAANGRFDTAADGKFAALLVGMGLRRAEWKWDVGQTPKFKREQARRG